VLCLSIIFFSITEAIAWIASMVAFGTITFHLN
jgi:hypothetical protein